MVNTTLGEYTLHVHRGPLPAVYGEYRQHATLAEEFALDSPEGEACLVAVSAGGDWPALVVAQRFTPCQGGFDPGVLLVPETNVLFIGAGTRLLAYSLYGPRRLWEDAAHAGFWGWRRHGHHVLMSAELELAAWEVNGRKLWSTFVEPPWDYRVEGRRVLLDVMGNRSAFPLHTGPFDNKARYRPLDRERDWNFVHPKAPIPNAVLPLVRPFDESYCRALWWTYVSMSDGPHIGHLPPGEWPRDVIASGLRFDWHADWAEARSGRVAELLREHVRWPDDATVYFFWTQWRGVETHWSVFRDHWMSFVFDDEFPVLLGPDHREAVIFTPGGHMHIGVRPSLPG